MSDAHLVSRRAFLGTLLLAACARGNPDPKPLETILFGSCNKPWLAQPLWPAIHASRPDLWIWLGDIVYADTTDMALLRTKYAEQKESAGYQKLRALCPIVGTWDDHDYGAGGGDSTFPMRAESQQVLLDFLDEPPESARRKQHGVYSCRTFGPPDREVKVLLLDMRYHRESAGSDRDPLGAEQWRWLETELGGSQSAVHLIGSSNELLATEHQFDTWGQYPRARQRLLDLLVSSKAKRPIILSGDRHLGEISRLDLPGLPHPLYDVTSSGMTHFAKTNAKIFWYDFKKEPNRLRVGENFLGFNFGAVRIDWSGPEPAITVEIRDETNAVRCSASL